MTRLTGAVCGLTNTSHAATTGYGAVCTCVREPTRSSPRPWETEAVITTECRSRGNGGAEKGRSKWKGWDLNPSTSFVLVAVIFHCLPVMVSCHYNCTVKTDVY